MQGLVGQEEGVLLQGRAEGLAAFESLRIAQVRRLYALTLQHYCRHATRAWTSLACPSGQQNRKGAPGSPERKVVDCFHEDFHIGSEASL